MAPITRGGSSKPGSSSVNNSSGALRSTPSASDRLASLEILVKQLVSRVDELESENKVLKSLLTPVSVQQSPSPNFHTPRQIISHEPVNSSRFLLIEEVEPNPETSEASNNEEGEWIVVKNKNNKIIKKCWKSIHKNHVHPVGNKNEKINDNLKRNKTLSNNRSNNRRRNNHRRLNRHQANQMNSRRAHSSHSLAPQNNLINDLTNFLMFQQFRRNPPLLQNQWY